MGLFNNLLDKFKGADFAIAPNKKLKTISEEFKMNFGLSLMIYKGVKLADGKMTINQLNEKTSAEMVTKGEGLKIKASMKVGDAEQAFKDVYGITVQIKDASGTKFVPNEMTIGEASRTQF